MAVISKRGDWTDEPCYYVTIVDDARWLPLAGPFRTHAEALARVDEARKLAEAQYPHDPHAPWYAYGTAKTPTGYREGKFNGALGI